VSKNHGGLDIILISGGAPQVVIDIGGRRGGYYYQSGIPIRSSYGGAQITPANQNTQTVISFQYYGWRFEVIVTGTLDGSLVSNSFPVEILFYDVGSSVGQHLGSGTLSRNNGYYF
jgi:hypothetical protein